MVKNEMTKQMSTKQTIIFVVVIAISVYVSMQIVHGQEVNNNTSPSLQEKIKSLEGIMNSTDNFLYKIKPNYTKHNFDLNYTALLKFACSEYPKYSDLLNQTELAKCEGLIK
jgi:hypothetical protein